MINTEFFKQFGNIKSQIDEKKTQLASSIIEAESGGNLIQISMSGDRKIQSLKINTDLAKMETEDLEDLLSVALNRALEQTDAMHNKIMSEAGLDLFGNI
jgi:DNA-binding protein YbaB